MNNTELKIIKSKEKDIIDILKCYDSANSLFEELERANGTYEIIKGVVDKTESYNLYFKNEIIGWIAWNIIGKNSDLEALYVKKDMQNNAFASYLINFYFDRMRNIGISRIYLSVLKNAYWAIQFYIKHGFEIFNIEDYISESQQHDDLLSYAKENNNSWSYILCRNLN